MMNNKYAKAYKEVMEIIKYFPEEEYNKISKERIDFLKEHMDKEYIFSINPDIDLSKQNISKEANAIIITIFQDFFATEEQKKKINEILEVNERKAEQIKMEKYNPDSLFKKIRNEEETSLIEYKENFFTKFKKFILRLLNLNN